MKSSDLDKYVGKFPMWIAYHADLLREKIAGMEGRKKEELLREECAKLDRFCEILCATGKSRSGCGFVLRARCPIQSR